MEPANTIIGRLGGFTAVAAIAGVHRTRVYSWTWDKDKGGTGGLIPAKHMVSLISYANTKGIELSGNDFVPRGEKVPA